MLLVIADDHNLFREALCYYLRQSSLAPEIIEASSLDEALDRAAATQPDALLLDFVMPGGTLERDWSRSGSSWATPLRGICPSTLRGRTPRDIEALNHPAGAGAAKLIGCAPAEISTRGSGSSCWHSQVAPGSAPKRRIGRSPRQAWVLPLEHLSRLPNRTRCSILRSQSRRSRG